MSATPHSAPTPRANAIFEHACAMGLEGLVCKLQDTPYRSGKSTAWLKIKCVKRDTFTIAGFSPDRERVAYLHLAKREGKKLIYVGKAGTGFSRKVAHELYRMLHPLAVSRPALAVPGGHPNTVWVRPDRVSEIEYRAITSDSLLRHAAFKRLREQGELRFNSARPRQDALIEPGIAVRTCALSALDC